jgi:hypothetical protein
MITQTEAARQNRRCALVFVVTVLVVGGLSRSRLTKAQSSGGFGPGQQGPPSGFGRGPQGWHGGPGGRAPFVAGTITGDNLDTGVLTIHSQFEAGNQTVNVTQNTQFATQTTVTVTDLKINDQIQIQGVPTGITASSITAGQMPPLLSGGIGGGMGGGFIGNTRNTGGQPNRGVQEIQQGQSQNFATANGSVVATSPLTLSIGNHMTLVVKLATDAKVTKISSSTLADLKVGDKIVASGQTDANGTFTATGVGVNLSVRDGFRSGGPRGFGPDGPGGLGGRGPGGPGGPDGFGLGGAGSGEPANN